MQPFPTGHHAATEPFVFARGPPHDKFVNRAKFTAKFRGVETTIVTYPSTEDRTHPNRYIFQLQVVALMQPKPGALLSLSFGGWFVTAGKKLTKFLPSRFLDDLGLNV